MSGMYIVYPAGEAGPELLPSKNVWCGCWVIGGNRFPSLLRRRSSCAVWDSQAEAGFLN